MKYEAVFGDQCLFGGAPDDCILVIKVADGDFVFYTENNEQKLRGSFIPRDDCAIKLAMRRIIRTPTWTVADQEAGKLPEVGCLVVSKTGKVSEVATIKNGYFVLFECGKSNGPLTIHGDLLIRQFKPIESPEEKAQRLREDWRIKALSSASILSGMQEYELKRLGGYIGDIYDALLSGELTMPSKDGE